MTENTYRVRIKEGDREFETEGDKQFVLDMLDQYSSRILFDHVLETESEAILSSAEKSKPLSIAEFIGHLGFKKHTDLVLAFGYYLEKRMNVTPFTAADINSLYYEAKLDSSNTSQMITQNIKRGFMMGAKDVESKTKHAYLVTKSGEEKVEGTLK